MDRPAAVRPPFEFLCIGAQKAGTTWLWEMLRRHPQVWMPPLKELHYFDRSLTYLSNSFLAPDHPFERLFGQKAHHREFRKMWRNLLQQAVRKRSWTTLRWCLRFGLGHYGDEWYASLFAQSTALVRGEITPSYSILNADDIARIHRLAPKLKIIFLLRNPVERAWSQVRFDWTRGAFDEIGDLQRVRELIDSPRQTLRSDYLRTMDLWEAQFPKEQIFIGFYDDITEQPDALLSSVLGFLKLDPGLGSAGKALDRKFNVSKELNIPEEIHRYLAQKYFPELVKLSARVGGPAVRWRDEVGAIARSLPHAPGAA